MNFTGREFRKQRRANDTVGFAYSTGISNSVLFPSREGITGTLYAFPCRYSWYILGIGVAFDGCTSCHPSNDSKQYQPKPEVWKKKKQNHTFSKTVTTEVIKLEGACRQSDEILSGVPLHTSHFSHKEVQEEIINNFNSCLTFLF